MSRLFDTSSLLTLVVVTSLISAIGGCATRDQARRLEARLTETQAALRESNDELQRLRQEIVERDGEIQSIRTIAREATTSGSGGSIILPASETLRTWGAATSIEINSLLTGVRTGGDGESRILQVVAQPVDDDGTALKVPGRIDLEILDPAASTEDRTAWTGAWTPEQARKTWEVGLLAAGYTLKVPLSAFHDPSSGAQPRVYVLIVKQTLADGRHFTDTAELTVDSEM